MRRHGTKFVGVVAVTSLLALTQTAAVAAAALPFEVTPIQFDEALETQSTPASGFVTTRAVTGTDPAGDLNREPFGLWGAPGSPPTGTTVSIEFPQWFIERNMSHAEDQIRFFIGGSKGEGERAFVPWDGVSVDETSVVQPELPYDFVRLRMEKVGGNWLVSLELAEPLEPDDEPLIRIQIKTPSTSQLIHIQGISHSRGFEWDFFHPSPTTFATYHRDYHDLAGATITQIDSETIEIEIVSHGQFPVTTDSSLDMSRYWVRIDDAEGTWAGYIGAEVDDAGWTAHYQPPSPPGDRDFDWWWGEQRVALEHPVVDGNRLRFRVPLSVLPLRNELKADVSVHLFLNTDFGVLFALNIDNMDLATLTINDAPEIVVSALPGAMLQIAGEGGATTTFTLTNVGDFDTTVTLTRDGDFFTLDPATFVLGAGASQQVVVTGEPEGVGDYSGSVALSGLGVPPGLSIPIRMVVATAPQEESNAVPESNRVDVAAPAEQDLVEASIRFRNTGGGPLTGLVVADVPWLQIMEPVVEIAPDGEVQIPFVINRTMRPDGESPYGSITGTLALEYLDGSGSAALRKLIDARNGGAAVSTTLVTVTDTAKPTTTIAAPPTLRSFEVAVFLAGLGHVQSGVGTFISDLHLTTLRPLSNLSFFYTPVGETTANSTTTTIASLSSVQPVMFADMSRTIFNQESGLGTLQIRGSDLDELAVSASVFNKSNPAGTYGSAIPPLRSDRAVPAGESLYIPGVVGSSANGRTNLIIQETSGHDASVTIDFLDPAGNPVFSTPATVPAFQHLRINNAVPSGSVAIAITNDGGSAGKILAYATPVDRGGDTWVVTDWPRVNGYAATETVIVPVAGRVLGRNDNFFRTSLAVINSGAAATTVTVRYIANTGVIETREIDLAAMSTATWDDVMGELFELDSALGFLQLDAGEAPIAVTSRIFATIGADPSQFGTGVPALAAAAMTVGDIKRISGFDDADTATISAGMPATFRTNLGLVETTGQPVTVRVTLHFQHPQSTTLSVVGSASKEYALDGHDFLLLNNVATEVLGSHRNLLQGNLKNLFMDVEVVRGEGAAIVFTSSVDNGTADQVLKLQ